MPITTLRIHNQPKEIHNEPMQKTGISRSDNRHNENEPVPTQGQGHKNNITVSTVIERKPDNHKGTDQSLRKIDFHLSGNTPSSTKLSPSTNVSDKKPFKIPVIRSDNKVEQRFPN